MSRFTWTVTRPRERRCSYRLEWETEDQALALVQASLFQLMAASHRFDLYPAHLLYRRATFVDTIEDQVFRGIIAPDDADAEVDAHCARAYESAFKVQQSIIAQVSTSIARVPAERISSIVTLPGDLVAWAAPYVDQCLGNTLVMELTYASQIAFDQQDRRQWTTKHELSTQCLSPALRMAQHFVNQLYDKDREQATAESPEAARALAHWMHEKDISDSLPPALMTAATTSRSAARWDYALFEKRHVGNDCTDASIVALVEVKQWVPPSLLVDLLQLANRPIPARGLGVTLQDGCVDGVAERLLAQVVRYCYDTGVRTGAILTGSMLMVIDVDGDASEAMQITLRTPIIVAPSAREVEASLPRPAFESRYSMLAQLVAFTLHAMDRAQRLGPRPPPRDTTRMVAAWVRQHSPIQQVSWPQGQVQPGPVTRSRTASADQNGGRRSYEDRAVLAKDPGHDVARLTQAVFIVDRPLFRGLCATVHSASCEGAAQELLAKVYRRPHPDEVYFMDFTEDRIDEVQLESIARHEATIYGLLWPVQGTCAPRLLATLSRQPDHGTSEQEPSAESCCTTTTLPASSISSPGSSKELGANTPAPSVGVHALLLEDVGKLLASHTLEDLQHTLATCGNTQALSSSSSKEVQDKVVGAIQAVFVHSAQQIHRCGVLHRDIAARNMCLRVVNGTLQGVFIDFHMACPVNTFDQPKEAFEQEIKNVSDEVERTLLRLFKEKAKH